MSMCERCWRDASMATAGDAWGSQGDEYRRLIQTRICTPEQQAGPNAGECPVCRRMTLHQHTGERMCNCPTDLANG